MRPKQASLRALDWTSLRPVADEMIAEATREGVAEVARILALQSAAYARKFGDLPLEDHLAYLKAATADAAGFIAGEDGGEVVGPLRDGRWHPSAGLAVVTEGIGSESDKTMQ